MDHTFPITVVDDKAANVAGATAALVQRSAFAAERHPFDKVPATHSDKGAGKYDESAKIVPIDGEWLLIVSLKGKSPVVQPLKLKGGKKGEFTATPTPAAVATVTITGTVRTVAGVNQKEIAFHVTLHPAAEIAFISGVDYEKSDVSQGWQFHLYAFNRAEILRREKKIHAGTIVTVFATSIIQRITRVWGGSKWVDIEIDERGDPKTRVKATPYQPVAGLDIHITDFYKHLAAVGAREPKSVIEIGIFSHSWPGGPILYNTGEDAAHAGLANARDPNDFDARAKDFNAANFPGYAKMADALHPSCRYTIWGCSATTHLKFSARAALNAINAGKKEDEFFVVFTEIQDAHNPAAGVQATVEENISELRYRFFMDFAFRNGGYAAEAAKKLNIEVRAGCPGTGSDPTTIDKLEMLMVDLTIYGNVFSYYHKKFSPEFAETNTKFDKGYIDYHALQSRAAVAQPPFASQYYKLDIQKTPTRFHPSGGAELRFWHGSKKIDHPTANVRLILQAVTGLADAGKSGHLMILKDKDDTKSQAVFVQEDAKFFHVTRNAKKEWKVLGAAF